MMQWKRKKGRETNGSLQGCQDEHMARDFPLHWLEGWAETDAKAWFSDQAGSAGMGKGAAEQIDSRFGYDFWEFCRTLWKGH